MTGQLTNSLPKECDSQKIGRLATKCFYANIPDAWKAQSLDGDDDCGYDFQIQTVDRGEVKDIFRVQLKGKTSPCLNTEGTIYSVALDVSTVNYYCRATEPILLVMCDLSIDDKPKNCHLYYQWIHDELERVRAKGIPDDQKTVTFHVPVANRLDDETDLSAEIEQFKSIAKIGEQLVVAVKQGKPNLSIQERIDFVQKIVPGIQQRSPSLMDALIDDVDSSWIEAPEGTLPWHIQNARMALLAGDATDTQTSLVEAEKFLMTAIPIEQADYWHMVGRLCSFELKDEESLAAFDQACRLTGDAERHLIPLGEAVLRLHFRINGDCNFSETLSRINQASPAAYALRARLIAAEGRYDDALAEAEKSKGIDKLAALAIINSMQARWAESLSVCTKGLAYKQQRESTKVLFHILKARAKFSLAIGPKASTSSEERMPLTGPAGTNPCAVREAWNDISTAIMALRKAGWPSNLELISDIWAASASILGLQESTLPVITEAAKARPTLQMLQTALESLAVQANNFKLALEANERLTPDINTMLRRVVLLHQVVRHRDCVELFESLKDLHAVSDPMLGYAYSMAVLSAERGMRSDLAEAWVETMATRQDLAIELALLQYFRKLDQQLLAKEAGLVELEVQYRALGYPVLIAKHLFHELDVMQADPAQRCVELSAVLESDHLLGMDDYLRLAQAFTTLGKWNELLELTNRALNQFDDSDRLLAIGALALDKLGKTAEAHQQLQELINKPDPDHIALNTYINIASVSGFSADAIRCIEGVLERATEKEHKLSCLRHLFSVIHLTDPSNPRLVEIAWKIGQIADSTDEAQEGLYLMTIFAATLPLDMPFKDEWKEQFQKRLEQFVNRFPNSKILRGVSLPQNFSPAEMLKILKEVAGIDEESIRSRIKIQNQLQQGQLPIPFAWRPVRVLNDIPDLPTLWELAKRSRWTDRHLHLAMVLDDWQQVNLEQMRCKTPILDLTTLLVIHDLEMFDLLFTIFPRIAIGKATLLEIQHMLSPMSGSPFREKCRALLDQLKSRFQQIEQPSADEPEEDSFSSDQWFSQEVVEIVKTRRYMLYSDDVIFRIYANPPADYLPSICTLDFLIALDQAEILSARQVAEKIAKLCSWRVGLRIPSRYQYAILPADLDRTRTISDAIDLLKSDELCNAMFSAIWDFGKEFSQLLIHAGAIISELVINPNNSLQSVSALAGFWLSKARFNTKAPTPSIKLLALLIVQAALNNELDILSAQRLWSVYRSLTEVEYGNRMDDRNYRDSFEIMAKVAVNNDIELGLSGENSIFARLNKGLTKGTKDHDIYFNEYQSLMIRKSIKKT